MAKNILKNQKNFQKSIEKRSNLWYNITRPIRNAKRWCGSMAEQLICNQQVVGSTPITSSKKVRKRRGLHMGDFPSGQRGQTVNLLSLTSVVRIHHPPPKNPMRKHRIFLSKPQAWHIIAAQRAVYIISPFGAVSHHAPACIFPAAWWDATLCVDDIQGFALITLQNYDILLLDKLEFD